MGVPTNPAVADDSITMPSPDVDMGSPYLSPKATRAATSAAERSPPGTGEQTRMTAEVARAIRAEQRVLDLEAALTETEQALRAAQLETVRVQLGDVDMQSISSEGSGPGLSDGELDVDASSGSGLDAGSGGGSSQTPVATGVFATLMGSAVAQGRQAKEAAAARRAEKEAKDARREEVAELRLPTEQQPSWSTVDWEVKRFHEVEAKTQERRNKPIGSAADVPKPRKGRHGWRHNSRLGLIGAVRYWANGSKRNVVSMLLGLINEFDVADDVRKALFQKTNRQVG